MSEFLSEFCEWLRSCGKTVFNVTEICNGVSETVTLTGACRCQNIYSVAKAFTATAVGMLADEGKLRVTDRITDILPPDCTEGMDGRWRAVTLDDALRHRMGVAQSELDIDAKNTLAYTQDHLQYLYRLPLQYTPGTDYAYSDAAFYLLGRVVTAISGEPLAQFLGKRLFWPMGFEEVAWSTCPKGYAIGASGLYITSADMAKLGELYRCGGVWQGKRIISEEWVHTVLSAPYELSPIGDFGYGKGGMYGQMLMVLPGRDRVVAWEAFTEDSWEIIRKAAALSGYDL